MFNKTLIAPGGSVDEIPKDDDVWVPRMNTLDLEGFSFLLGVGWTVCPRKPPVLGLYSPNFPPKVLLWKKLTLCEGVGG